jgi:sporulation protein YlmC with PRC-barrel domain
MRTFTSIIGRAVMTQSGRQFGRCHDLRASSGQVEALIVGRLGLLDRLGIAPQRARDAVAWEAVVRIEGQRIVVRDGTEIQ